MKGVKASAIRRSFPIIAYVGANGGGKSLAAVYDSLYALDRGRVVLSTVPLYDPEAPLIPRSDPITGVVRMVSSLPHPNFVPLVSWRQLMAATHCDILLDEVTGVASSRGHASLPAQLGNLFVQLRRRDVTLRWTTPNYMRADVILREVTQAAVVCAGHVPIKTEGSEWPQRSWFKWQTYDAQDYDDFEQKQVDKISRPLSTQWYHRTDISRAPRTYDTLEGVSSLDHVDESGSCVECGGHRSKPKCSCITASAQMTSRMRSVH
jgi:hypothetical protein